MRYLWAEANPEGAGANSRHTRDRRLTISVQSSQYRETAYAKTVYGCHHKQVGPFALRMAKAYKHCYFWP